MGTIEKGTIEKGTFEFRIDTVAFLNEIVDCAFRENQGVLKVPLNVFRLLLLQVSQRATEINDAKLNILMLRLGLYECKPNDIPTLIEQLKKQIDEENSNDQVQKP